SLAALGMTLLLHTPALHAQEPPQYSAAELRCARFLETSSSEIRTESGVGAVDATMERHGTWSFRARDTTGGVALEAWYDSLVVRRRSGGRDIIPDTDGLIGGRYRGVLTPHGGYSELARPFVPDEVAEVADLSSAARDLLPPLPPRGLAPGESWSDSALAISRLPDTVVAGHPLVHFHLKSRTESDTTVPRGDTVPIAVRQTIEEEGDIYWSPGSGLVRRLRDLTIEATVPTGGRVRRPVRSRVEQRIELTRLPGRRPCT
ncbi:MAG TPA: hypothetical protein VH764_16760, partial [Gemmatimonadales bacterium]